MGRSRVVPYDVGLLTIPDGAADVVRALSEKYMLGIATSRTKAGVFESPLLAHLQQFFQVTISYEDTNNHKPHPEPLLAAAAKLNIAPEACVYIGDAETDIEAARAACMKVIIFSQNQLSGADASTFSFTELPALIAPL